MVVPLAERQVIFLIAPQRTGTTVLRETLAATQLFDPFGEVFHPEKGEYYSFFGFLNQDNAYQLYLFPSPENIDKLFEKFMQWLLEKGARKYKFVDVKQNSLHHFNPIWQHPSQPPHLLNLLRKYELPILRLKRKNLFNQALSTIVASHTGTWHVRKGSRLNLERVALKVPPKPLEMTLRKLSFDNRIVDSALAGYHRLLKLDYETLFQENQLNADFPGKLASLLNDMTLRAISLDLVLEKSISQQKNLVSNRAQLLRHFRGTKFAWMLEEALE